MLHVCRVGHSRKDEQFVLETSSARTLACGSCMSRKVLRTDSDTGVGGGEQVGSSRIQRAV